MWAVDPIPWMGKKKQEWLQLFEEWDENLKNKHQESFDFTCKESLVEAVSNPRLKLSCFFNQGFGVCTVELC